MFLAGSIGVAVEEMWRLAVAMASLKYIAQVVRQEVQRDIIDTDSEIILEDDYEDISLGNGLDANEDITEGLDTNEDITKGLDANKDITKGLDANEDIENKEQDIQSLISMKSHVLDNADTPTHPVTAQFSVSMISHCQPCKDDDQYGQYESDPYLMTSMVAHWSYGTENPPERSLSMNMKNLHLLNKTTTTNKENKFFSSSVAHQLPMIDCPLESYAYKISMVSHEVMENNKNEDDNIIETDSVSMLAHQICNEAALQPEDIETPKTLVRIPNNIVSRKHDSDKKVSTSGLAYKHNIENILNEQVLCDEQITRYFQTGLANMQENIEEDDTSNLSAALLEEADGSRMCDLNLSKQWLFKPKFGSYKNFLDAARISHQNTLERVYLLRIKRIQEIQEHVEYEIDEYKRRKNMLGKDKNGSVKEYKLLTNVKGIEFELHILIHQSDAHNEDIENSVSNNLAASEYRHKDKKQMCDKSENKLKKTIKHDPNIEHIEHGNELDKSQLLHDLDVSKDSLADYKEHILKVKTCTFAPGNDINLAIEQLLLLASTMENTLKYIVGMIYTDYEQENTFDLSEPKEEKQHSSNLTYDPLDINQMEDNILDGDKSSHKHVKQIDIVSIADKEEQQQWVEDTLNTSLKPLTNTDKTFIKSEKGSTNSLFVDEDCNCVDKEITDEYIHIDQQDELVTGVVAGDVTDLEPIETASDASAHNSPHCYIEADQSSITSFVGHQVIAIDLPEVFVQMPLTLASHMIAKITEEEDNRSSEMDPGMRISMVAHQIVVKDNTKTVSDEDLLKDIKNIHDLNPTKRIKVRPGFARQLERHYLRMQDNVLMAFSTSMVSHQLPYLETGLSRFSVSATTHIVTSCAEENSESLASMVTYQIRTDKTHINSSEQETNKLQLNNVERQTDFYSSLASHQLPMPEGIEYPECITSMTAHQDITMGKYIENTNAEVSMHTYASVQDNTITYTGLDNSEQTIRETEKGEHRLEGKRESLNTDENATLMNKTMHDEIKNKVHLPDSTEGSKKEMDDNNLIKVIKTSKTKEKSVTKLKIQARGTIESKSGNKNEQTYKVRFRVKLTSQDGSSSKSSVLQYLRGCLTGQSLFQAKQ